MSSPDLRQKFGKAGHIRAMEECSKEIYFRKLINFYTDILENNK
jgi:hypothetical protein